MFLEMVARTVRIDNQIEPESIMHFGSYPEESPTHFVYEVVVGGDKQYYLVQQNPDNLVIGRIKSDEDLEGIRHLKQEENVEIPKDGNLPTQP